MRRELGSAAEMRAALRSWRTPLIASGGVAIAAFILRAMTAGQFQGADEGMWMKRSVGFSDAVLGLDFSDASAATSGTATMPGVTTMWLGTVARGVWELGRALGMIGGQRSFAYSEVGLHLSQLVAALATSLLIGLFVVLAWRWAGAIAAIAAGALLATEPFLVSQGAAFLTDELVGLFAATGTLALLIALGVPGGATNRPRATAVLAGALLAGAFLSKLTGLLVAPGLPLIVIWALIRGGKWEQARRNRSLAAMRPVGGLVGIVLAAGIVTTLVAWPAIWADPLDQISALRNSAGIAERGSSAIAEQGSAAPAEQGSAGSAERGDSQVSGGDVTSVPQTLFYLVAIPFRMTPWFLLGLLAAVVAAALAPSTRARLVALAVVALPALVALSLASKQYGRYGLVVLPLMALVVGVGLNALWARLRQDPSRRQIAGLVAAAAIVLVFAHSAWVAPWGGIYFNPLLGGSRAAERTLVIGGSYGQKRAGELIQELEAPACHATIAVYRSAIASSYPCGRIVPLSDHPDYYVIPIDARQRNPEEAAELRARGETVAVATIRGITHAEIIRVDSALQSPEQPPPPTAGGSSEGPEPAGGQADGPTPEDARGPPKFSR